ncbi:MAG: RHS repeat protein, partial [Planctomycetes bacterium]|nr:RHS repeat protein [Planctomycetota bacterium]
LKSIDYPNDEALTYEYDGYNLSRITDALGRSVSRTYDARGNITSIKDFNDNETLITYNGNNKPETITDPQGNITQFVYDALDRLEDRIDHFGESTHHMYDAVGNLIETTDRNGRNRTFEYDDLNRKTSEKWYHGPVLESEFSYTYDEAGRMLTAIGPERDYTYTHDPFLDQILTVTKAATAPVPAVTLTYEYDDNGKVTRVKDNNNFRVTSTYNVMGQLHMRTFVGPGMPSVSAGFPSCDRGKKTRLARWKYIWNIWPAGIGGSDYTYDEMGRHDTIAHIKGVNTALFDYDYNFDIAGQLGDVTHHNETFDYNYDGLGQLQSVDRDTAPDETYTYDVNGNRLSSYLHQSDYINGDANRILSDGQYNYGYDNEGNIISKTDVITNDITIYAYDHRNRMTAVVIEDST